jgi:transcriptional regulator with XRE-family HTH domain
MDTTNTTNTTPIHKPLEHLPFDRILRGLMRKHGLKIGFLASELGFGYKAVWGWLNGSATPSQESRAILAEYFADEYGYNGYMLLLRMTLTDPTAIQVLNKYLSDKR